MIKVMIIDDSALIREILTEAIDSFDDMIVVGTAPDPIIAREKIKALNPDVLTLDIEMPKMHGLDFLERLMKLRPMPVIMISSLTQAGSDVTFKALALGAVDFIGKPTLDSGKCLSSYRDDIACKIRAASIANIQKHVFQPQVTATPYKIATPSSRKLIAIGASTGGTEALKLIISQMPANSPPMVVTQHMSSGFTQSFTTRLNEASELTILQAKDQETLLPGHVYIAPEKLHMRIAKGSSGYVILLSDEAPINFHKPSVDALFSSVAKVAGRDAMGIILTGMGKDGAEGLLAMKNSGAYTIAQNKESCVVYGMPKQACLLGAAKIELALDDMVSHITSKLNES